jgi:integrase
MPADRRATGARVGPTFYLWWPGRNSADGRSRSTRRHTFASLMIAAGVNAKGLATYMGHASVTITLDRYGQMLDGLKKTTEH